MAARLGNQLATLLRTPRRLLVLGSAALVTVALILSHNQGYVDFAAASPGLWPSWSDAAPSIMGQGEPLVFSLIVVGNETAYETEVLLKVSYTPASEAGLLMPVRTDAHLLPHRLSFDRRRKVARIPHKRLRAH